MVTVANEVVCSFLNSNQLTLGGTVPVGQLAGDSVDTVLGFVYLATISSPSRFTKPVNFHLAVRHEYLHWWLV